jgi:hypothetical protein
VPRWWFNTLLARAQGECILRPRTVKPTSPQAPLLRAVAAVVFLAGAAIACSVLSSSRASAAEELGARPPAGTSTAEHCTSAQLTLALRVVAASMASSYMEIILTNRSADTCELGGAPTVTLTNEAGKPLEVLRTDSAMQATLRAVAPNVAVRISPRHRVSALFWEGNCNGAETAGRMDSSTRWNVAFSRGPILTEETGPQLVNCPRNAVATSALQRGFATRLPGYVGYVPPASLASGGG